MKYAQKIKIKDGEIKWNIDKIVKFAMDCKDGDYQLSISSVKELKTKAQLNYVWLMAGLWGRDFGYTKREAMDIFLEVTGFMEARHRLDGTYDIVPASIAEMSFHEIQEMLAVLIPWLFTIFGWIAPPTDYER